MNIDVALSGMDQRRTCSCGIWLRSGTGEKQPVFTPIFFVESIRCSNGFVRSQWQSDQSRHFATRHAREGSEEDEKAYLDPEDEQSPVYELAEHVVLPGLATFK